MLNCAGAKIGSAGIMHGSALGGDFSRLRTGNNRFINIRGLLQSTGAPAIGDQVALGPGVPMSGGAHDIGTTPRCSRKSDMVFFR